MMALDHFNRCYYTRWVFQGEFALSLEVELTAEATGQALRPVKGDLSLMTLSHPTIHSTRRVVFVGTLRALTLLG